VPYLALKIVWASGSRVGIPGGSTLLANHTTMIVGSIESALLDSMVVVLALLLTQPWVDGCRSGSSSFRRGRPPVCSARSCSAGSNGCATCRAVASAPTTSPT
jgi:hypothetical protein